MSTTEYITTTAPISIELLKKYFVNKNLVYIIDFENSKNKINPDRLLIYLSNLDIPSDILVDFNSESGRQIVKEYFNSHFLLNSSSLEQYVIKLLMCAKGIITDPELEDAVKFHREHIDQWLNVIESLFIYNMLTVDMPEFKEFADQFEKDDTIKGINFVNLLKYEDVYSLYSSIDKSKIKYYTKFFDEYVFKGKNLFQYWANENNPIFLLFWGVTEGLVSAKDINEYVISNIKLLENAA
jgi:hypothetical protein